MELRQEKEGWARSPQWRQAGPGQRSAQGPIIIAPRDSRLQTTCRAVLLLVALSLPFPDLQAADSEAEQAEKKAQLKDLRARIAELDKDLEKDVRQHDSLRRQLQKSEKKLSQAARKHRLSMRAVERQKEKVKAASRQRQRAIKEVDASRNALANAVRAQYMTANPGPIQLLFRLDDIALIGRLDSDARAVAAAMKTRLNRLEITVEKRTYAELALREQQETLEQRATESERALGALKSAQTDRRGQLQALANRREDRATALAKARAEQARVETLLKKLSLTLSRSTGRFESGVSFAKLKGRLPWPMSGSLIARFGSLKNGGPLTWTGWWIQGDAGTPVRAVADGQVVYVGWLQRYGLIVIIDHPGNYLSLYGHLQEAHVEVGSNVKAGSLIADAGTSGGHRQSGVYFEIREQGAATDPRPWLVRASRNN